MSYKAMKYEISDEIATVTFNRPAQRNAFDIAMRVELAEIIAEIREDMSLKAVILTGAGGAFCAGGDLKSLSSGTPSVQHPQTRSAAACLVAGADQPGDSRHRGGRRSRLWRRV